MDQINLNETIDQKVDHYINNSTSNNLKFKTPEQLLKKMDIIQYGFMSIKGKKILPGDSEWFKEKDFNFNNYRILQPEEVWKYKIGTCLDQSILEYYHLNEMGFECKFVYIEPKNENSHALIFFKQNNSWFRFEHSFELYKGIYGPYKNINESLRIVIKQMKQNDPTSNNFKFNINVDFSKLIGDYNLTLKKFFRIAHKGLR